MSNKKRERGALKAKEGSIKKLQIPTLFPEWPRSGVTFHYCSAFCMLYYSIKRHNRVITFFGHRSRPFSFCVGPSRTRPCQSWPAPSPCTTLQPSHQTGGQDCPKFRVRILPQPGLPTAPWCKSCRKWRNTQAVTSDSVGAKKLNL